MSSATSVRPAPDAETLTALAAAAVSVAEDSLFAFAEPCTAEAFAGAVAARSDDEPWIGAAVRFHGPFDGVVRVDLPRDAAIELCSAFSGAMPDELAAAEVHDFSGEVGNMICGLWLTRAHGDWHFTLDAPAVREGERPAGVPGATSLLTVNDAPMVVSIVVDEGPRP